jgi:hypothetical protein
MCSYLSHILQNINHIRENCLHSWSHEHCNVLSLLSGRNEVMHLSDSPYYVALSPDTSLLAGVILQNVYFSKRYETAVGCIVSNAISRKLVLMDIAHASTQVTNCKRIVQKF